LNGTQALYSSYHSTVDQEQKTLSSSYLLWKDRTPEINASISKAFQSLISDSESKWGKFNGSDTYELCGIKEHRFVKKLIQRAPTNRTDFYVLDIGAGNFQWGRKLALYLNAKTNLPKDITIHIIGIRGEKNQNNPITELGRCKLYELGRFQIERLAEEFPKRGLQLENKVDLVVTRWCFRHLVDPVGTFAQVYDLLRPETGHFLFDGFFIPYDNEQIRGVSINFNERMSRLCLETGAPFLTQHLESGVSLDHFVLRKLEAQSCRLKKEYSGILEVDSGCQIGSYAVTRFKNPKETEDTSSLLSKGKYRGDKEMHEKLKQARVLCDPGWRWGPLLEKDNEKKTPRFHGAIACGDEEAISRCLQDGCDINESDFRGLTPLHLSIEYKNYALFLLLLKKGASAKLFAKERSPLHHCMEHDLDGCFIIALINAGADVNIYPKTSRKKTPLASAIEHKNIKGVELLLAANAIVT